MEDIRSLYWRHLEGRLSLITTQLTRVHFASSPAPDAWLPSINAYCCPDYILLVAELAGVDQSGIQLVVEPRRVWLRGHRRTPEPHNGEDPPRQVLAMEIDAGPFARELVLPLSVDPDGVEAEQRDGLLWIRLPIATPA
ncbi:MAG: hypothetical protein RJA22_334 [Verrucomicrobiota bacterium]|jgi:HSP20 family protein